MGYGKTSVLLRKALIKIRKLEQCWFTNIMKCSFDNNKRSGIQQYEQCINSLFKEIDVLKPEKIIALGNNVYDFLLKYDNIKIYKVIHPSYCLYKQISYEKYSKIIGDIM